jgi:hypothetical protein
MTCSGVLGTSTISPGQRLSGGGEERKTNHQERRGASGREPKASPHLTLKRPRAFLGAGERRRATPGMRDPRNLPAWPISGDKECASRH